jgi:hypothetical protein
MSLMSVPDRISPSQACASVIDFVNHIVDKFTFRIQQIRTDNVLPRERDQTSRNSASSCRAKMMLIWRKSWTKVSASATSPGHMAPSTEIRLTKRFENDYNFAIRCLADWLILHALN